MDAVSRVKYFMRAGLKATLAVVVMSLNLAALAAVPEPSRFAAEVAQFSQHDEFNPWPEGAILATGSSSMRFWSVNQMLERQMAPLTVINRGFGGSVFNDLNHYLDQLVLKYRPRAVMIYEGDNDIALGLSQDAILDSLSSVIAQVHDQNAQTRFYLLSVKPSISRWLHWPAMQQLNEALQALCATDARLVYIDVASPMLGEDNRPGPDIYVADGLHLNELGYQLWRDAVRPVLMEGERQFEPR